jgi:hypothetical protein
MEPEEQLSGDFESETPRAPSESGLGGDWWLWKLVLGATDRVAP